TLRYFYLYFPHHLAAAEERESLDELLLDPGWLKAKLSATGSPLALITDYEQHGAGELQNFIGRTLRLTAGILARDQRQLMPQLLGRIMNCRGAGTGGFLEAARRQISPPAILTQRLSLTPPGAETARLEGHSGSVAALWTDGSPRAPGTTPSGCGTWPPGPRPPAWRDTPVRSPRCACCRTDGSPRAPMT